MTRVLPLVLLFACGDNALPSAPGEIQVGPVTLDTKTLGLTFGALAIDHFLSVGTVPSIDPTHYYDATDPTAASFETPQHALGMQGDWIILEDGTKLRLVDCTISQCAELDIDASAHANAVFVRVTLPKDPAEPLYGTGDAAIHPNVSGTVRVMELRVDPKSASGLNETHVPVPLVMWPRENLAMFVADDRPGAMDLGATAADRVDVTYALPARGVYKIYLTKAATPIDLVRKYVQLTAKPAVPPRWAFAPQQWRNEWTNSAEMLGDAGTMRNLHIPGSVMWIDNPWETAYNDFAIDTQRFADAQTLIATLGAQGYKVMFWSTPYVNATGLTAADHAMGVGSRFFVTDDGGGVIDYPWSNGPGALVDFSQAAATAWWRQRIAKVTALGAAGFKLDYGEDLVPDIGGSIVAMETAAGDNEVMHNRYAGLYHAAYLGALPPGDGFLITRAGAWGEQATNTAIWPGDLEGTFEDHGGLGSDGLVLVGGLPSAISRGLSLSVSGYPFYGSDIGGFRGFPTTEVLLRWAEYAAFGTIMQLGGGGKSHDPWDATLFDPTAADIYKRYATQHIQLFPYLYSLALAAGADGTPVTRPARFVFDCACDDAMFLLGDALLVAPVVTAGATTRVVVLPPGDWIDRATGAIVTGDGHAAITVPAALDTIPTWQRANTLLPTFARFADTLLPSAAAGVTSYADPVYGAELRVDYTPILDGQAIQVLHDGARLVAQLDSLQLTGGSEYSIATFALPHDPVVRVTTDLATLPPGDVTTCATPGCWSYTAGTKQLLVRLFATKGTTRTAIVH